MNGVVFPIVVFELFFFGVMIGYMAGNRENPNEPKPKKWEQELHNEYVKGFRAGEKSMAKSMTARLKETEIYRLMYDGGKDHE